MNTSFTKEFTCTNPSKPRSDTNEFNGGFMHTVHLLYLSVQKRLEHILTANSQISFSQFLILAGFSCGKNSSVTQVKLAEHLMLTEATVSRHIRVLVAMKLLDKQKDVSNKKSYELTLTPKGKESFSKAKALIMKELEELFSHIPKKDKRIISEHFATTIKLLHQKK